MRIAAQGPAIADSKGLKTVGFVFGAVTIVVALLAGALVHTHANGGLSLEDTSQRVAVSSPAFAR